MAGLAVAPEVALNLVAGGVMVGVAGWLIYLDHKSRVNIAFAFYLVIRGLIAAGHALDGVAATSELATFAVPFLAILVPFTALAFAFTYRDAYGSADALHVPGWLFLAAGAIFAGAYLVEPRLWFDRGEFGPLFLSGGLTSLAYGLLALMFGYEYIRAEAGPLRRSLLLVSLGFALNPTFSATTGIIAVDLAALLGIETPLSIPLGPFFIASHGLENLALVPIVATCVLMVRDWQREEDQLVRPETKRYIALVAAALLSAIVAATAFAAGVPWGTGLVQAFEAIWEISLPVLITYSVLRHQLFDIDIKVKNTVRQSAVAGSFGVLFFITSESLEALVPVDSTILGMVAAGAISLTLVPVQRFAENVADRVLPGVKAVDEMTRHEQLALYRDQVEIALADGEIAGSDRRLLDVARDRLRLSAEEAARVEREAKAEADRRGEAAAGTAGPA